MGDSGLVVFSKFQRFKGGTGAIHVDQMVNISTSIPQWRGEGEQRSMQFYKSFTKTLSRIQINH